MRKLNIGGINTFPFYLVNMDSAFLGCAQGITGLGEDSSAPSLTLIGCFDTSSSRSGSVSSSSSSLLTAGREQRQYVIFDLSIRKLI